MTPSWPKIMFYYHPCLFLKIYSLSSFTGAPVVNTVNKMYPAYFFFLYILHLLNIHIYCIPTIKLSISMTSATSFISVRK